ncbi:uncharacterized protein LOC144096791 [Amblyomma americanum]
MKPSLFFFFLRNAFPDNASRDQPPPPSGDASWPYFLLVLLPAPPDIPHRPHLPAPRLPNTARPPTGRVVHGGGGRGTAAANRGVSVAPGNGSSACSGPWAGPWAGGAAAEAALLLALAALGMGTNCLLMGQVAARRRGWAQGLLFHQGLVDCTRAGLLLPLGLALLLCQRAPPRCPVLESAFLLLVTVSTVNLLTWVLSDGGPDSPQCLALALFLVWFASVTVQLGPTFLAGARAAHLCPVQPGPHYVLGLLWVSVNALCVLLTAMHLRRLHRDLCRSKVEAARVASLVTAMMVSAPGDRTMQDYVERQERWGLRRLRAFGLLLAAYMLFWGPLFVVTLVQPKAPLPHQVAMHVAFVHATVNPALLLVLDTDPRGSPSASPLQLPVDQLMPLETTL